MFSDTAENQNIPVAVSLGDTASWKRVESVGEVWQIDDEWWRDRISRRYVDTILQGGKHIALYEDLLAKTWFTQLI